MAQTGGGKRSGLWLGAAHVLEVALPFVRSVAIARLMEPKEFALSLMLMTVVGMAELATDIGLPQLAVKSDIGDAKARGTLHALAIIRSSVVGALIALAAWPLAHMLETPGAALAFVLAGASVALKGFGHLAIKQMGRHFDFRAEAATIAASQIAWTIAVVALAFVWRDHRAMVAGLFIYVGAFVLTSHLASPMRYGLAWRKPLVAEAARFGWPLVPNGVALAVNTMGDRVLVGARLGLEALALYGPVATAATLPRGISLRYVYNLVLPAMVRAKERGSGLAIVMRGWIAIISLLGVGFALGFIALGEPVVALVFGARYAPPQTLVTLMAILLFCRILVTYPVPLAIAMDRTWFVTASSAVSAFALLAGFAALLAPRATQIDGLVYFLAAMAAWETLGVALIVARTRRAFPDVAVGVARAAAISAALVYGVAVACHISGVQTWVGRLPLALAAGLAALAIFNPLRAIRDVRANP